MAGHEEPTQFTSRPIVTGTSVVAIKFSKGVVIAADNLASYGSLARFTDVKRLRQFGDMSVIGVGGDVSDMQYLDRHLTELAIDESYESSGSLQPRLNASNLHRYLVKLFYSRRNQFDPLWNQVLVTGFDDNGDPFLGSADLRGTGFTSPSLATGFGAHLAQPILRLLAPDEHAVKTLDQKDAVAAIRECMKVLFYRDARSSDTYSIAVVTKDGITLDESEKLEDQSWAFADKIKGYGSQVV
jgi:20S proteasome subunit beta 7